MKKVFRVFLMVLLFAAFPLTAFAVESPAEILRYDLAEGSLRIYEDSFGVLRYEQNGIVSIAAGAVIVQQSNNKTATENTITVESGDAALTISGLNIVPVDDHPIAVSPNASLSLTLEGENFLTAPEGCAGIWVPLDADLTIKGAGSLEAVAGQNACGIGGRGEIEKIIIGTAIVKVASDIEMGGTIVIESGTIAVTGGNAGAGIGCKEVIINNGTVAATGGMYGAGIGGAYKQDCESVVINGGTVTATGGKTAAGIGGGGWSASSHEDYGKWGNGETITINDGVVVARSGAAGAGIGAGFNGGIDTITINGGTIEVFGDMAGIGCQNVRGGDVFVNNGHVTITDLEGEAQWRVIGEVDSIHIEETATVCWPVETEENVDQLHEEIIINNNWERIAALVGSEVTVEVDAYGYSGLSYQWEITPDRKTWEKLEGETTDTITIPITNKSDRYWVCCLVRNGWGNEMEFTSVLYVLGFAQQPESVSALAGERVTLTAASTCPEVSYQWERSVDGGKNWFPVEGETAETLAMEAVVLSDNGLYRCVITAENGDRLASDAAEVTVSDPDAAVVYSVEHYWQTPDGRSYVLYDREILPAMQGQAVAAEGKPYVGFGENVTLGCYNGIVSAEPLVLSCYYDRKSYTAAVDVNEGTAVAGVTARYGEELPELSVPTREGYFFDGWYCDEAFTHPYAFNTMPAEDFTVYAKWRPLNATRGQEYEIGDISFRQNGYHITSHIPDGVFFAEVQMKNMSSDIEDVLLLTAYDENGRFLKLYHMPICSKAGETFMLRTSVDNSEGAIAELKAFALPDRGDMAPLGNTVEFPILAK